MVVLDAAVMYVEKERVMRSGRNGRTKTVCDVPTEAAHAAMTRWERDTGTAALDGVWMARSDPKRPSQKAEARSLGIGDRLPFAAWHLHHDDVAGSLYLVNHIQPHVVIALEASGGVKWCTYLSAGCCGGAPIRLANGELVVSSGCGGSVSWLDATGRVAATKHPPGHVE